MVPCCHEMEVNQCKRQNGMLSLHPSVLSYSQCCRLAPATIKARTILLFQNQRINFDWSFSKLGLGQLALSVIQKTFAFLPAQTPSHCNVGAIVHASPFCGFVRRMGSYSYIIICLSSNPVCLYCLFISAISA